MKIEDLILEILKKGVSINSIVLVKDLDVIGYNVNGFSKSGTVTLFDDEHPILKIVIGIASFAMISGICLLGYGFILGLYELSQKILS